MLAEKIDKPLLYRMGEVAELLGISERKVDELIATRELKSVKIGKSRRVPATALDDFIKARLRASR